MKSHHKSHVHLALLAVCAALVVLPAMAQLRLPEYTRNTLGNGVTLVMMPKRDVPLVTLKVMAKGGTESEPEGLAGVADITNDLLMRGTTARSADAIAEEIDFLGASISTDSDTSSNTVTIEVLSKDLKQGVEILADLALGATFPEDEVAKELARAKDRAKAVKDNPRAALSPYAARFFFGDKHPYGRVADEETIAGIRREHIVDYHKRFYVGANLVVIAVGDFDPKSLQTMLGAAFAKAGKGTPFTWAKADAPSREKSSRVLLVDDTQATQTYFQIIQPGLSATSDDRVPMMLVNTLFGGRFTSMLNDALRVNAGLTYGVSSILQQRRLPGSLAISTFTANETTEKAIDMALDVLRTLRKQGVDADQLESAKAYVKGGTPTRLVETNDQLADLLAGFEVTGKDRSEIDTLFTRIDAVTVEDARRVIDTYYRDDNLTFVLLGQQAVIGDLAKKYGPNPVVVDLRAPGVVVSAGK